MPCQLLRSAEALRRFFGEAPLVLTVGNFDGMHRGHSALFEQVRAVTQSIPGAKSALLTLAPHPRQYFAKLRGLPRGPSDGVLTSLRVKLERAGAEGFDALVALRFSRALAELTPEQFLETKLLAAGSIHAVVVGEDWHFGKNRAGNVSTLRECAARHGFEVRVVTDQRANGERISSSQIRMSLAAGDVASANELLGRPYLLTGHVRHGDERGRTIGFPTANLLFEEELLPAFGVYKTRTRVGSQSFHSVTNVGERPTFAGTRAMVETHILDGFSEEIYGKRIRIEFLDRVRPEIKFEGVEELKAQIGRDIEKVSGR